MDNYDSTESTESTESKDTQPDIVCDDVLVAKVVIDEIAQRVGYIYQKLEPLQGLAQQTGNTIFTSLTAATELREELGEEAGAVLRLLETLGADLLYPAPLSKETLEREARIRQDPRIWAETMSRLKAALPHGIAPETGEPGK